MPTGFFATANRFDFDSIFVKQPEVSGASQGFEFLCEACCLSLLDVPAAAFISPNELGAGLLVTNSGVG